MEDLSCRGGADERRLAWRFACTWGTSFAKHIPPSKDPEPPQKPRTCPQNLPPHGSRGDASREDCGERRDRMASQERCCCTNAVARANARPAVALDLLASGRAALSEGRWERARELFERARALEESGEAVEGLAIVALWRSEVEVASKTSERAFHLYRERGDRRGAARMAIWLAFQAANFTKSRPALSTAGSGCVRRRSCSARMPSTPAS